jgi:hypothetical protein
MDCNNARSCFPYLRPGELDGPEAQELHRHLAGCPECHALAAAQRRLDEHLGRAMRDVPVPAGLRAEILLRVAADRGDWYRRWAGHAARAAAAAVLLLGLGVGGVYWFTRPPARLQADLIVHSFIASPPGDAEAVDAELKPLGVGGAPAFFNYAYLAGRPALVGLPGYAERNVKVPQFVFTLPPNRDHPRGEHAVVFVVSQRRFRLDEAESYSDGDKYHFALFRESDDAPFAYLVFYTGADWDWLKT